MAKAITRPCATSGVTGAPALTTTATQFSPVGNYPITITQGTLAGGNNYQLTFVHGTLTVYLCGGIIGLNKITIGASSALVDSYNSSNGPYPDSPSNQASLFSNGTITLQGAKVYGDLVSARQRNLQANSLVTGDVVYGTTLSNSGTAQGSTDPPNLHAACLTDTWCLRELYRRADYLDHRRLHL